MSLILYRKPDPTSRKPSAALFIVFFILSFMTVNTYYLVFGETSYRFILWTFLATGYLVSIYTDMRFRPHLELIVNLLALVFFAIYFRHMIQQISNFGSLLGQLLAVLLVLRSYILFSRDDFFVPLVISLTIMLLCSIPSYESNYVISLQFYFFVIIACLYLMAKTKEFDERRLGYFELEKMKKNYNFRREARMLVLFGVVTLFVSTAIYLFIPHQQGMNKRFVRPYKMLFGTNFEDGESENEIQETVAPKPNSNDTYVGFNENSFKIAHGKSIREGENANDIVMTVQMDYPRYMRAMVWDKYVGGEWERSSALDWDEELLMINPDSVGSHGIGEFEISKPRAISVDELKANRVKYDGRVTFVKGYNPSSYIFLPWESTTLKIGNDDIWITEASEVRVKSSRKGKPIRKIGAYSFSAESYLQSGMEATYLRDQTSGHYFKQYTQLPDITKEKINGNTIESFSQEIIRDANAATDYEKTIAVFNYLKSVGRYSTSPPYCPPEYDIISYFILEVNPKNGHCEIFASAMTLMLRSLEVPCRVATGYTPGSYSFNTNSYVIKEKHAHAWVEVYFPEIGWIEFDPTPNTLWSDTKDKTSEVVAMFSNFINELYVYSPRQFYDNRLKPLAAKSVLLYNYNSGRVISVFNTWFALELIVNTIIAVVIIASIWILVLLIRGRRDESEIYKRKSRIYYSQITQILRQKGTRVAIGATPTDILVTVENDYPDARDSIEQFLLDFWVLNYAPRYQHKEVIKRMRCDYRTALHSLRKSARKKSGE